MEFEINNSKWIIEEVEKDKITCENDGKIVFGTSDYIEQKISLLKEQANIIKTLKHELTHVWLHEYGHNQNNDKTWSYEDICEIVSSSNDFINEIVDKFKKFNKKEVIIKTYCGDNNGFYINPEYENKNIKPV